eukprot:2332386-Pyramimonas_sp.AAC.1
MSSLRLELPEPRRRLSMSVASRWPSSAIGDLANIDHAADANVLDLLQGPRNQAGLFVTLRQHSVQLSHAVERAVMAVLFGQRAQDGKVLRVPEDVVVDHRCLVDECARHRL